jgi:aspartate/methionine/tyrosine aminotransferase
MQAGVSYCQERLGAIAAVRQLMQQELEQIRHLCTIPPSQGAFYFFLNLHTQVDALKLVEQLIREHKVAAIPGTTFGMHDGCYLRIAYGALQQDMAADGIRRLVQGLQDILGRNASPV